MGISRVITFLLKSFGIAILIVQLTSCSKEESTSYYDISNLPVDTGGIQQAFPLDFNDAEYGFYIYKPHYYDKLSDAVYPLLIFLHGAGEKGNSSDDPSILARVLKNGPPKMIENGSWNPSTPMIVVSPQCHDGGWNASKLQAFVSFIIENYHVNVRRIYISGLSMGGGGTFSYLGTYGEASWIAAAVPICGWGNPNQAESFEKIPVWAFHGEADSTVKPSGSVNMIEAINAIDPVYKAKLTLYPNVGHNSWTRTYDGSGMGTENPEYDAFNKSIYDWMLQYQRKDLDTLIGYEW